MKKILIGYLIGSGKCGIDTYLFHFVDILKDKGYKFDFLTNEINENLLEYSKRTDSGLFEIPSLKNPFGQYKCIKQILEDGQYDIAYFNISEAFHTIGALAAKSLGIKKVIIHSHAAGVDGHSALKKLVRTTLHNVFKYFVLGKCATDFYAASSLAADWMFSKKDMDRKGVRIIYNAIEIEKYRFSQVTREKLRAELGIKDEFVIGHVSGFTPVKNISFLVDVFQEVKKEEPKSKLLLIGEGIDSQLIKEKVEHLGLSKDVIFTGVREDVNDLMQAMDAFVFPSLFEGLGIVAIEAQLSGLKVFLSDRLPKEVELSDKCHFLSLENSAEEWAKAVLNEKKYNREFTDFTNQINCFDINLQNLEV